jgi:hypothetical protein
MQGAAALDVFRSFADSVDLVLVLINSPRDYLRSKPIPARPKGPVMFTPTAPLGPATSTDRGPTQMTMLSCTHVDGRSALTLWISLAMILRRARLRARRL